MSEVTYKKVRAYGKSLRSVPHLDVTASGKTLEVLRGGLLGAVPMFLFLRGKSKDVGDLADSDDASADGNSGGNKAGKETAYRDIIDRKLFNKGLEKQAGHKVKIYEDKGGEYLRKCPDCLFKELVDFLDKGSKECGKKPYGEDEEIRNILRPAKEMLDKVEGIVENYRTASHKNPGSLRVINRKNFCKDLGKFLDNMSGVLGDTIDYQQEQIDKRQDSFSELGKNIKAAKKGYNEAPQNKVSSPIKGGVGNGGKPLSAYDLGKLVAEANAKKAHEQGDAAAVTPLELKEELADLQAKIDHADVQISSFKGTYGIGDDELNTFSEIQKEIARLKDAEKDGFKYLKAEMVKGRYAKLYSAAFENKDKKKFNPKRAFPGNWRRITGHYKMSEIIEGLPKVQLTTADTKTIADVIKFVDKVEEDRKAELNDLHAMLLLVKGKKDMEAQADKVKRELEEAEKAKK